MNRFLSIVFLLLVIMQVAAQEITREDADSMLRTLDKTNRVVDRIDLLLELAQFHILKPGENPIDFDSASTYIKEAARLNESTKSPEASGYLVLTQSFMTREKGQGDEAKKMVEKAIQLLEAGKDKSYLGKAYYELSEHYNYWGEPGQLSKKIELVQKSIDAFQLAGNIKRKAFSLKMLGHLYSINDEDKKAIETLRLSLDAYNSIHYEKLQGIYILLATVYRTQEDHKQALEYGLKALKTAEALHDTSMQLCQINNTIGVIYSDLGRVEMAIAYLKAALITAEKYNDNHSIVLLIVGISVKYNSLNQSRKALDFLASLPKKYLDQNYDEGKAFIAMSYLSSYLGLEQPHKAKEKESKLQQTKLVQAKYTRNLIFVGVALLLVIIGLLVNNTRLRQRTNKKLEMQQKAIGDQNLSLRHLVNEKDWLVKEIHHRVKNNFQTVMGLLGTQSGYLKNEVAINAVTDSRHRIHAMSLIHQRLYQTENLSAISMPDYIHELIDYLRDSFTDSNHIRFSLQIERIELDLAHCIPLGLILNEAITNSFKYAFPGGKGGIISIIFTRTSTDHFLLAIKDTGTGLPSGFNIAKPDSMGMNLMRGLSEEIGAKFSIGSQDGTQITVSFVYRPDVSIEITQTKTESTYAI